jgi:hypothetical protein
MESDNRLVDLFRVVNIYRKEVDRWLKEYEDEDESDVYWTYSGEQYAIGKVMGIIYSYLTEEERDKVDTMVIVA